MDANGLMDVFDKAPHLIPAGLFLVLVATIRKVQKSLASKGISVPSVSALFMALRVRVAKSEVAVQDDNGDSFYWVNLRGIVEYPGQERILALLSRKSVILDRIDRLSRNFIAGAAFVPTVILTLFLLAIKAPPIAGGIAGCLALIIALIGWYAIGLWEVGVLQDVEELRRHQPVAPVQKKPTGQDSDDED